MSGTPALVAEVVLEHQTELLVPEDPITPVVDTGGDETRPVKTGGVNFETNADDESDSRSPIRASCDVMSKGSIGSGGHELGDLRQ